VKRRRGRYEDGALVRSSAFAVSGQAKLQRIDGWQGIPPVLSQRTPMHHEVLPPGCRRLGPDFIQVVKIRVLYCAALQDIEAVRRTGCHATACLSAGLMPEQGTRPSRYTAPLAAFTVVLRSSA
jgi:hypothetical protein